MIEIFIDGKRCVNLPGSDYYVTCEGTLLRVTSLVTKPNRKGYMVTRKGTQKYYSKEQLLKLYDKFK